jgi:adenylate kinase family enzyme
MARIFITGNAGSGKTTLATQLGAALGHPVTSLDSIVWLPGWQKRDPESRRKLEQEIAAMPDWVVDGVSRQLLAAADFVVFLDVDRLTCFARCAVRNAPYLFRSRPGLPEGCPELAIVPKLVEIIWQFPSRVRPWIVLGLAARDGAFLQFDKTMRTERAVALILERLAARV